MLAVHRGARGWAVRDFESRCVDGRPFEIFSDVIEMADAKRRCVIAGIDCSTRVSWNQLEKFHIQARRRRRNRSEDSADVVLTISALTRIDDSDNRIAAHCSDVERYAQWDRGSRGSER